MSRAYIPSEEVVLFGLRHVVSSGGSKAVIQQYVETKNRTLGSELLSDFL